MGMFISSTAATGPCAWQYPSSGRNWVYAFRTFSKPCWLLTWNQKEIFKIEICISFTVTPLVSPARPVFWQDFPAGTWTFLKEGERVNKIAFTHGCLWTETSHGRETACLCLSGWDRSSFADLGTTPESYREKQTEEWNTNLSDHIMGKMGFLSNPVDLLSID